MFGMPGKKLPLFPFASFPLLFGHRGCPHAAPENTLAAFQKILDFDIPGVEFDVHRCGSGELVVIHDDNLKRVTGYEALVAETDYSVLKTLDAGSWFGEEYRGEKIPLLDEVLDFFGKGVYFDIEIKHRNKQCGPTEQALVEAVRRHGITDRVMISSFNPYALGEVRRLDKSVRTAHIYIDHEESPRMLRHGAGRFLCLPDVLKPEQKQVGRRSMFFTGALEGYPVIPWTVDQPEEALRLLALGASGIISNVPETMQSLFPR
jgi:glycerophosphoryl diester phosphodiesterase